MKTKRKLTVKQQQLVRIHFSGATVLPCSSMPPTNLSMLEPVTRNEKKTEK